jgi:hypothetical protein
VLLRRMLTHSRIFGLVVTGFVELCLLAVKLAY